MSELVDRGQYWEVTVESARGTAAFRCASRADCEDWRARLEAQYASDRQRDNTETSLRSWYRLMGERDEHLPAREAQSAGGGGRAR